MKVKLSNNLLVAVLQAVLAVCRGINMKISNYMNNTNSIMEKILIKYRKEIVRQTKNIQWGNQ